MARWLALWKNMKGCLASRYNCYSWVCPGASRYRGTSLHVWLPAELQTLCMWQTHASAILSNHHIYLWVREQHCMSNSKEQSESTHKYMLTLKEGLLKKVNVNWQVGRDSTSPMFRGETVTCNYSWHSSETHSHTNTKHPTLSGGKRLKGDWAKQVNSSLCASGKSWKPKKTKTGTHPSPREQCYTTMRRPRLHLNHMISSFEFLLGNYVNPYTEGSNFPQHNWPLARSPYVFQNMVKSGKECENCK